MPLYTYSCGAHGGFDAARPFAEAAAPAPCPRCGDAARRTIGAPNLIVRPHGYHLRPGEPGYWDVGRALEVGHVPAPNVKSNLGAGAPDDSAVEGPAVAPALDDIDERKLREVVEATYGAEGDTEAQRIWREARQNGYGQGEGSA